MRRTALALLLTILTAALTSCVHIDTDDDDARRTSPATDQVAITAPAEES